MTAFVMVTAESDSNLASSPIGIESVSGVPWRAEVGGDFEEVGVAGVDELDGFIGGVVSDASGVGVADGLARGRRET